MGEQQDTFISHLVELRDRLLRTLLAVGAVFVVLFFYPGSGPIYDYLAAPLLQALPEGTKMIATGVITPFLVPVKVTAWLALIVALPYVLYQAWAFVAPGLYAHEKRPRAAAGGREHGALHRRGGVLLLLRLRQDLHVHQQLRAAEHHAGTGHRRLLRVRAHDVPRVRRNLRDPGRGRGARPRGHRQHRSAQIGPAVRDRRLLRGGGDRHAARRAVAVATRDPDVRALRSLACSSRASW